MRVVHLALGGCLRAPPVRYGLTADTGGHIAYVLEAAAAQAAHERVSHVTILTRLFRDARLGDVHARAEEPLGPKCGIVRLETGRTEYLEKSALGADLPQFTRAFLAWLADPTRRPDVIHAHFADAAAVAQAACARFGIPFVYTPHALGLDKRCCLGGAGAVLEARIAQERTAIARASAIVVSSRDEASRQIGAYGVPGAAAKIVRIMPGVPHLRPGAAPGRARAILAPHLTHPERPMVLAIARPVQKKNLIALARAYAASPELQAAANLVMLSGQHDSPALGQEERDVISALSVVLSGPDLAGRVALPSAHDAQDVAALYREAAEGRGVFVNCALHEPFGLTLLEATTFGLPVVATRVGGPVDILSVLRSGVLIDPANDAEIAAACLSIVSDPMLHRRLRHAALRRVRRLGWDRYGEASIGLYARLLAERDSAVAAHAMPLAVAS